MFEPNQYRELCSELHVSEEKLEEVIQMTEQEKKRKFHRPMRLGLVAAAVAAMLVVTVSAANSGGDYDLSHKSPRRRGRGEAWADSPVNTEEGTGRTAPPGASLEERDGRTILIVDGVETDVTQALTDQGEYCMSAARGRNRHRYGLFGRAGRVPADDQLFHGRRGRRNGGGCGCPGGRGGVRKRPHRAGLAPWCSPDC